MEWKCIKEFTLDHKKDEGHYLILVGLTPKIAYFGQRNWNRSWHIPDHWKDPTHYIKIPSLKDYYFSNVFEKITHD